MARTSINDLPDVLVSNILALVSDTRTRNSLSLVCRKFLSLERATRFSLSLRGNARDLYGIPTCFRSVTHLDLSLLSPWGHAFLCSSPDPDLLAHRLRGLFPLVTSLTVYARTPTTLQILARQWPELRHVKLVRWHQRPQSAPGEDLAPIFEHCRSLSTLDLSEFYYWIEDIPPVLVANPLTARSISKLNLMTTSLTDGFKSTDIETITEACPNLSQLLMACTFDPRYFGFVGDETLSAIATNCPRLSLLHLADTSTLASVRGDPSADGFTPEDARISTATLIELFSGLPLLEDLVLDVAKNVRDSGPALEVLNTKCRRLRSLKLGQFHGICMAIDSRLDGIALCQGLESLSITNCADLTNMRLIEVGRGCVRLSKFEVKGCKKITVKGLRTMVSLLKRTLVDVKISCCENLNTKASLRALEPIQDRISRLHVDCVWKDVEECELEYDTASSSNIDPDEVDELTLPSHNADTSSSTDGLLEDGNYGGYTRKRKRSRYSTDADCSLSIQCSGNDLWGKRWDRLEYLSLWIGVGDFLSPLETVGLDDCPVLQEIQIKVEGDCRRRHKPMDTFGLSILGQYPQLAKMKLDCSDTTGYALTCPSGQMDLTLWERFFLNGIGSLGLTELDYWPPQDRSFNQRSLSHPAAGLLAECLTLRKLFIHGTAYEHFMNFLLNIPYLRDVQLRLDYYPAPENDMSTEMRAGSCSRFEAALNSRQIPD
ncbi:F-box/LRR-repeat MAX2 homolog A [Cucumis sativus]|uniref:F-box/leucine rich repeat protein n=1 Tax=Cucumis sativus TaxID=3659 RepID=A0A0A0K732_CUCSA|nr:F-box/LRR-repeat MAX2 homolog A [Cucumis sativus]KGN43631.1 hypothetical protein Csa_017371 [Cucumis sativus]